LTDLIRNLIWAVLLVAALILGIVRGHWFTFIFLAASFFVLKGTILIQLLRLRKAQNELMERFSAHLLRLCKPNRPHTALLKPKNRSYGIAA
jgi:hypothetical protein